MFLTVQMDTDCAIVDNQMLHPPSFNLEISSHNHDGVKAEIPEGNLYYACVTPTAIHLPSSGKFYIFSLFRFSLSTFHMFIYTYMFVCLL